MGSSSVYATLDSSSGKSSREEARADKSSSGKLDGESDGEGGRTPDGDTVSLLALFRFSTIGERLLLVLGSLFAIIEGAGYSAMSLVFGSMTNVQVSVIKFGFIDAPTVGPLQPASVTPGAANNASAFGAPATAATTAAPQVGAPQEGPIISTSEFEARMATFSLLYVAIGGLVYLSCLIQIYCWQSVAERQTFRIREAFFRSVLRQELAWFDRNRAGDLAIKFNDDIERLRDGTGEQFSLAIKYASSFFTGFAVGFAVSWRLTLVIMAATPLLALFSAILGRLLATSTKREQEKYALAGALAEEVLVSVRTVLALNGQRDEIARYRKILDEGKRIAKRKYLKLSFTLGLSLFVLYSTYGLALFVSTILLDNGMITAGAAIAVIMSVMMGANALGNIIPPLQTVTMARASASLIYRIIESRPTIDAFSELGERPAQVRAHIRFDQVSFTYPTRPEAPVINGLSFELREGQTVALCGRTGSGKSTVINLLLRFYDPQQGAVYLDGRDLRHLNVAWLRSLVGIVEQEPALFDCSIYDNIALGATCAAHRKPERVRQAAALANAHHFIEQLPDGYETRCGDRGVQMSGGQKQRIAIARALLSDPKILLLDEATSALDSESEAAVQLALNQARQGRTTIVVAHRLSTIRDADLICIMHAGRLVERGRHAELLERRGAYYNLVMNQMFSEQQEPAEKQQQQQQQKQKQQQGAEELAAGEQSPEPRPLAADRAPALDTDGWDSDNCWDNYDSAAAAAAAARVPLLVDQSGKRFPQQQNGGGAASRRTSPGGSGSGRRTRKSSQQSAGTGTTTFYESINRPMRAPKELTAAEQAAATTQPAGLRDVLQLARPEMPWIYLVLVAASLSGAIMPVFALFYVQIIETLTKTGAELVQSGTFWALMFVALASANFLTMTLRSLFMATCLENLMARLRAECFANILRQHVGWFDAPAHSAQRLSTRLASDVPLIKAVLNTRVTGLISGAATVLVAVVISFCLGWQLALLLTLALPILLYVGYLQMRLSRGDRAKHLAIMEAISRLMIEATEHVKLIQAINQERHFYAKFERESRQPLRDSLRSARLLALVYGLSQAFIYFVYAAAFRWGAHLIVQAQLDPLTVFRVFFAIAFTAIAVGQWSGIGGDLNRANQAVALIKQLLHTQSSIDNLNRGGIKPVFKGLISFQNVYFRYPTRPDSLVLQGLSLSVRPGQTLALVGPSGNGKSTIASLLLRFYDPDRGVVRVDGHDIRCINIGHLRHNIGLVSQEPCLFKASIRENILYGLDKSRYTMRDVVNAAKLANIDDFIKSLPDGYETQVGERGTQMSGGQKQRIAIARTVIRNPSILILDEATSALDAESEALVNQALEKASKGMTCIKIAHRLSTVRDADQIAVVQRGIVVELGTHDELMALGPAGHYFRLMQKQEISS